MTRAPSAGRTDRAALARLIGPTTPEDFGASTWGRRPLLTTVEDRGGDTLGEVFSLTAVDELIADRGLRTPFLRVAKDGTTLPDRAFTAGGGVGAGVADQVSEDRLLQLFADGATIVLQGLHRTWPQVRDLGQSLAADLGHPVQANAYLTPAQNQGFASHYDVHDVFVLQVHGEKRWMVHEPVHRAPLRDEPWTDHREAVQQRSAEEPFLEATLCPGDVLYLPRGWIHSARALGGVSAHLTFGVHVWTRHHLAEGLLDRAAAGLRATHELRASLAIGLDPGDAGHLETDVEIVRQALLDRLRELPAEEVGQVLRGRARAAQRPASLAPLAQLAAADALQTDSTLRLREQLMLEVLPAANEQVSISSRAGRFALPDTHVPALDLLRAGRPVPVAELAAAIGRTDPDKLDAAPHDLDAAPHDLDAEVDTEVGLQLARTLVRRGVAVVVPAVGDTGEHV